MFVALATVFLLFISQGQCLMNATAILHPADLELYSGTLIFTQENADSPVRITGSIGGLNASSAHVRFTRESTVRHSLLSGVSYSQQCGRRKPAQL